MRLEKRLLLRRRHEHHALLDALDSGRGRRDRDVHRVRQVSSAASSAIVFGMVAEKNSVCRFAGTSYHDLSERHDEAEVEHLVGLVDDEDSRRRRD